jgi:hypothetical protein
MSLRDLGPLCPADGLVTCPAETNMRSMPRHPSHSAASSRPRPSPGAPLTRRRRACGQGRARAGLCSQACTGVHSQGQPRPGGPSKSSGGRQQAAGGQAADTGRGQFPRTRAADTGRGQFPSLSHSFTHSRRGGFGCGGAARPGQTVPTPPGRGAEEYDATGDLTRPARGMGGPGSGSWRQRAARRRRRRRGCLACFRLVIACN